MTSDSHLETVEERTGVLVLELRNKGPETTSPVSLKYFLRDLTVQSALGPAESGCTSIGGGVLPSL